MSEVQGFVRFCPRPCTDQVELMDSDRRSTANFERNTASFCNKKKTTVRTLKTNSWFANVFPTFEIGCVCHGSDLPAMT